MDKIAYHVIEIPGTDINKIEDMFNDMGDVGWKLVAFTLDNQHNKTIAVFTKSQIK